jgi:ATP-binding protein involved in chromosome partitioning
MQGSDTGKPTVISEPESSQSQVFLKIAKSVAGRISVLASEMNSREQSEQETKNEASN